MEFVVAKVEGGIDGLEGFEINIDFSFFAFRCQNFPTINHQSICGNFVVEFETLLGGCNRRENGLTIYTGLDIRGSALIGGQ